MGTNAHLLPSVVMAGFHAFISIVALFFLPFVARPFGSLERMPTSGAESLLKALVIESGHRSSAVNRARAVILDSFDEERRRIEQDLHDGVQQTMVSTALTLGLLARHPEAGTLLPLINRAIEQNRAGLQALRGTLLGISPQVLADHGLVAALRSLVDASSLDATLSVEDTEDTVERCDHRVGKAAYFIVSEALTNVAKHADDVAVAIAVGGDLDTLRVRIADRGPGGADPASGSGLAGLAERASALGGYLTVASDANGTVIDASIPRRGGCVIDEWNCRG